MFLDLKEAIKDVFSNKIRGLILITTLLTLLLLSGLFITFGYCMSYFELKDSAILEKVIEIFGFLLLFIASLMMFPSLASFVATFFLDSVVERTAKAQNVSTLRQVPLSESLKLSGLLTIKGISLSFLLIPVSLLLSAIPFLNLLPVILYYRVNGGLLAREYFFAVALRYCDKEQAEKIFKASQGYFLKAGIIIAFLMTCPVVNMISPLVAMTFMQRLFLKKQKEKE